WGYNHGTQWPVCAEVNEPKLSIASNNRKMIDYRKDLLISQQKSFSTLVKNKMQESPNDLSCLTLCSSIAINLFTSRCQ
ncbi:MAG: hypothetical protein AB8B43_00730, partial [Prochlorococcus sp.]